MTGRQAWRVEYDADKDRGIIRYVAAEGDDVARNGPDLHILAGVMFQFQHGPVGDNGINGIQNEELTLLLIMRMKALDERFPCIENKRAIASFEDAYRALNERTRKRREQGVEGKNEAHVS